PRGEGPFLSDRGLLVPYERTGRRIAAEMVKEWAPVPDEPTTPGMDEAEVAAFTDAVHSFLLYKPSEPLNVLVGWCSNDYQIDVALPEGRDEYKRLIDRAAQLGARYVLYAPSNSAVAHREDSVDDWSWEHVLWLGLGQKIRKGEWDLRKDAVPASVQSMLDYAAVKDVKLLAYVYPVLPFSQNPAWIVTVPDRPGKRYANLGVRALQDWLIDELIAFYDRTGIGGFAFDHTFLTYPGASRYAQWAGWRRVMETLRRQRPGIVIDGRQAYHLYGPWSWLAGSYPHPTASDEQPESFVPFPDLHFDRVSADRERYTAYRYRNYEFAPSEIVPGFITHQTSRSDDTDDMPSKMTPDRGRVLLPYRQRDWDYLGWRYSLLSSIAIAGWNNVLNMVPARDPQENRFFSSEDARWFRHWIDWTASHKDYLRHTRTILGQPALGKVDGTSAIVDDRGYIFLFNPNARRLEADVSLDESIGLTRGEHFVLRELYPLEGRLVGKPGAGVWTRGDRLTLPMEGASALVLELQPDTGTAPLLFNAPGSARIDGDRLILTGVSGSVGSESTLMIRVPSNARVREVSVNGTPMPPGDEGPDGLVTLRVRFAGAPFGALEPIVPFDPSSTGGTLRGSLTIPQRVFDQLAARRRAWPIPWTAEDLETTWLAPERLLMFVQFAEPDAKWNAALTIDGRAVPLKKAYTAVRAVPRTFVGFYADLSSLTPDRPHRFELTLPTVAPGSFQGVYFENVVTEYTSRLARAR
ncbi:MAG TPA: hypothetical protein VFK20_16210, partial [Vicinamibacterales bacterium]|nr:hypothetical protein [Vicinamibacterales bacterium]